LTDSFKAIEIQDASVPWAAAGSNATLYLTAIDSVNLNIGSVLCPPGDLVPLATHFTARIIVFDIQVPITAGASVIVLDIKHFHLSLSIIS
jgi:elongation factor 1 alpha-like protein